VPGGRITAPASAGLAGAAAAAFLYHANPHTQQVFVPCPFHALTGLYCPGCGGLRMVHDLLHGDPVRALHDNALAVPAVGFAAFAWLSWAIGCWRGRPPSRLARQPWFSPAILAVMVAWTVVRNLPFAPFTAMRP
jgi:hypothetical protein